MADVFVDSLFLVFHVHVLGVDHAFVFLGLTVAVRRAAVPRPASALRPARPAAAAALYICSASLCEAWVSVSRA